MFLKAFAAHTNLFVFIKSILELAIIPRVEVCTWQETRKECHSWIWPRHPWNFDARLNNGAGIFGDKSYFHSKIRRTEPTVIVLVSIL